MAEENSLTEKLVKDDEQAERAEAGADDAGADDEHDEPPPPGPVDKVAARLSEARKRISETPAARACAGFMSSGTSRVLVGVLLVLLAAGLGAVGGALFDRSAENAERRHPVAPEPAPLPSPHVRPHPQPVPVPHPVRPAPKPSPKPSTSQPEPPATYMPPPAPPPLPTLAPSPPAGISPPPFPPLYVGPEDEEPPPAPICHFHQPSAADDPTTKHPGTDRDRLRRLVFVNECDSDLLVNIQGFTFWDTGRWHMQDLPHDGGFPLAAGDSVEEFISERLYSGRIWARPNCRSPCNIVSCGNPHNLKAKCTFHKGSREPQCLRDGLWCDTGNCPGGNETTCRGEVGEFIGGLPPGPLLELTLCGGRGSRIACYKDGPAYNQKECDALPTSDYYDISNVDGTSKIWAGMEVIRGRRLTGAYAPQGRFNCGAANMPGAFDMSSCPQPLRIARNDSDPHGYSANATVEDAVGCLSACNFMSQVAWSAPGQPKSRWVADRRRSQNQTEGTGGTQPDESTVTSEDVARTCCECGHGADRGICPAPRVMPGGEVRARARARATLAPPARANGLRVLTHDSPPPHPPRCRRHPRRR